MNLRFFLFFGALFLFFGCSERPVRHELFPKTALVKDASVVDAYDVQAFDAAMEHFKRNCAYRVSQALYASLCEKAGDAHDAKAFFLTHFDTYRIESDPEHQPLLTGYYEPLLHGSRTPSARYAYPLYGVPRDLLHVKLDTIYPELKGKRLRGRLVGREVVAYDDRKSIEQNGVDSEVICYVDDKCARFFLEVQGSGRVVLDNNETIFVGYADQNGHPYSSIGKVLIERERIPKKEMSLQRIDGWLREHSEEADKLLHVNASFVFFQERDQAATGAMGVVLTPMQSVAVDPKYLPYGAMLSLQSPGYSLLAFAEDTGGAIRGSVRADLFMGFGHEALIKAGALNEPLSLWVWLPKEHEGRIRP